MGQYEPDDSRKVTHSAKPDASGLVATGAREDEARKKAAEGDGDVALADGVRQTPPRGQQEPGNAHTPAPMAEKQQEGAQIRTDRTPEETMGDADEDNAEIAQAEQDSADTNSADRNPSYSGRMLEREEKLERDQQG